MWNSPDTEKNAVNLMMAIGEDRPLTRIEDDLFDRKAIVDMISNGIIQKITKDDHGCYVIGVYGKWGEGKSTVFNFIKENLKGKDNIQILEFNPWLFKDQESFLLDFFNTLIAEGTDRKIAKQIKKYAPLVSLGVQGIGMLYGASWISTPSKWIRSIGKAMPDLKVSVSQRKKKISSVFRKSGKYRVVFIDDIDRLDKEETHAVFKLVKQNADFDNMVYLLAMDEEMVAKSISDRFGMGEIADGRDFIEKIVQVPVTLPKIQKSRLRLLLGKELRKTLEELPYSHDSVTEHVDTSADTIVEAVSGLFETRRDVVRYINQLQFVLPTLYAEVNVVDLCLLEAVKLFHPAGYDFIRRNKEVLFHQDPEWAILHKKSLIERDQTQNEIRDKVFKNMIEGCPSPYAVKIGKIIKENLCKRFFRYHNSASYKQLLDRNYFDKYFIGCTPDEKISDGKIVTLSRQMSMTTDYAQKAEMLNKLLEDYGWDEVQRAVNFIVKLGKNDGERNAMVVEIAISVAFMGFDSVKSDHRIGETYFVCGLLQELRCSKECGRKVLRQDKELICDTCKKIVRLAPLDFLPDFVHTITEHSDFPEEIIKFATERIISERGTNGLFDVSPFKRRFFFKAWAQMDYAEMERCVVGKLRETDFDAVQFFDSFAQKRDENMNFFKSQSIRDAICARFSEEQINNNPALQALMTAPCCDEVK